MRNAYELAHATAILFAGGSSTFVALDEITFSRPVPIGALLSMTSTVVFSRGRHFHIRVIADVMDPFDPTKVERTNTFWFTFSGSDRRVVPQSYEESMLYIEGRRKTSMKTNYKL